MATSNLRVDITADASGFTRGTRSAAESARVMERELARVEARQRAMGRMEIQAAREMETAFARRRMAASGFSDSVGKAALIGGGVLAAGLALSARAAMNWESAFAGVKKVVDGTPEQMAALSDQLRGLAKTMPVSAEEIAGVAEAAGQLDVARKDIASFTATAVRLGVSTNLSSEEAATSLSQLGNIMGVSAGQADRAGASLVALGNAGASTEADILAMSLRIAGAGRTIGLSEAQVLGYANAMSSLGIEAESGGTAISRVFLSIDDAARNGGKSLQAFAQVSGMTATQFKNLYARDAAGATNAFVAGLGKIQAAGGDVAGTLKGLGLDDIRVRDTMLRLAGASDQLSSSVKLGTQSWGENSALVQESGKRFETAESKIAIAQNRLNDAAIDIGGAVLPVFASLAQDVGTAAELFQTLPGPVKQAAVGLAIAATAIGVIGGAAAIAIPKVVALKAALGEMGARGQAVSSGMGRLGTVLTGPAGIGIAAGLTVATVALGMWAHKQIEAKQRTDELTDAIKADSGALGENVRATIAKRFSNVKLLEAASHLGLSLKDLTDAAMGSEEALAKVDAADANDRMQIFSRSVRSVHDELSDAGEVAKQYAEAMGDTKKPTQENAVAAADAAREQALLATKVDKTADRLKALVKALDDYNGRNLTLREANRAWEQSLDDLAESLKKNGKSLDIHSQKGRDNAAALDGAAKAASDRAKAVLDSTKDEGKFRASLADSRKSLEAMAVRFGMSKKAARAYVDTVLAVPRSVTTQVTLTGVDAARAKLASLSATLQSNSALAAGIYQSAGVTKRAAGGLIPGPASTADTVPALLSTGEYVMNAASVARYGPGLFDALNARRFAAGGMVTTTSSAVIGPLLGAYTSSLGSGVDPGEQADALRKRADAAEKLRLATMKLHEVEKARHHTALQLAKAEDAVRRAREALAQATAHVADVGARAALQRQSPLSRLSSALGRGVRDGAAFVRNIETLASRGFGELARQLTDQGDADAEAIAAEAVRSPGAKVAGIQRQLAAATQVQQQRERLGDISRLIDALRSSPAASLDDLAGLLGMDVTDIVDLARLVGSSKLSGLAGGKHLLAQLPKREYGGSVTAGQAYIVGEKRAELFVPAMSGRIIPQVSGAMYSATTAGGGGGGSVNLVVNASTTEARALIREGVKQLRHEAAVRAR